MRACVRACVRVCVCVIAKFVSMQWLGRRDLDSDGLMIQVF